MLIGAAVRHRDMPSTGLWDTQTLKLPHRHHESQKPKPEQHEAIGGRLGN